MNFIDYDLIKSLRAEAEEVKKCFTNFSFVSLTFSATVFGLMVGAIEKFNDSVFAALPVVALLMAVSRIGVYKYSTANRNFGYELHLARLESFKAKISPKMAIELSQIEWEEALRAWRVVQTSIFRKLYRVSENTNCKFFKFVDPRLYTLKKDIREKVDNYKESIKNDNLSERKNATKYPWFMPAILAWSKNEKYSSYHAGSYLQHMMSIILIMQFLLILPMGWLAVIKNGPFEWDLFFSAGINLTYLKSMFEVNYTYAMPFIVMVVLIWLRHMRIKRRRLILENEILSIHSCGVIWQVVALAHVIAKHQCNGFCEHYTEILTIVANKAAEKKFKIHQWLNKEML